jgi:hypothetical protein
MGKTGEDNFTSMPQAAFRPLELVSQLGLEDLTGIRERSKRRKKRQNGKQLVPVSVKVRKANRPQYGLHFVCQACHYTLHADLIGARNIALRTWCIRQDWVHTGQLSVAPDDASCEAKAARLLRYAELRWSSASSSLPLGGE